MIVEELNCKSGNKNVTVCLSYDEIRDISNGLYNASLTKEEFSEIYAKMKFLFDMVKHGNIQDNTVERLHKVMCPKKEEPEITFSGDCKEWNQMIPSESSAVD